VGNKRATSGPKLISISFRDTNNINNFSVNLSQKVRHLRRILFVPIGELGSKDPTFLTHTKVHLLPAFALPFPMLLGAPFSLAGFKESKPVVFSSIYPMATDEYQSLRESLEKYELNDASLTYQKDSSAALGQGFRCGFLGLLHLEIFQQRLEREYNQAIVMTVPSVQYLFSLKNGETLTIDNPQYYPDPSQIQSTSEPYIKASLLFPEKYMGVVMKLCLSRRGSNPRSSYPTPGRIELIIDMPLAEAHSSGVVHRDLKSSVPCFLASHVAMFIPNLRN